MLVEIVHGWGGAKMCEKHSISTIMRRYVDFFLVNQTFLSSGKKLLIVIF